MVLAVRSIAKSFSGGKCSGCASSKSCSKGTESGPMCESTVADLDEAVARRLAERH